MAGLLALVEQRTHPYQGLVNFNLYKLAAADKLFACNSSQLIDPNQPSGCSFYDLTSGNNNVPGQIGYSAAPGYDLATGLGSVNAENLADRWASVVKLPTRTKLLASASQIIQHGQALPMGVVVTPLSGQGSPTGSFDLMTDKFGTLLGGTLVNGVFSGGVTGLPGGDYQVKARYSGDAMFGASRSREVSVRVNPEDSVLNVQPLAINLADAIEVVKDPINYGWPFGLQINVLGKSGVGSPSGTVAIEMDGKTPLGTFPLNQSGNVFAGTGGPFSELTALNSTGLLTGNHTFTVSYSGDNSFKPSNSAPVNVAVRKATAEAEVIPVQQVYSAGVPVDFVLAVSPQGQELPTGTVQLFDCGIDINDECTNSVPVGGVLDLHSSGPLGGAAAGAPSQATYRGSFSAGTHSLRLAYSGDSNYLNLVPGSIFSLRALIDVNSLTGMKARIELEQSPGTITLGQSENYVISVKPSQPHGPMPTGTVSISDQFGDFLGAPVPLSNGNASLVVPWFFAGPELVFVSYSGDTNYSPLNSPVSAITTVKRGEPSVALMSSVRRTKSRSVLTVTVQVPDNPNIGSPVAEGGRVQFFDSVNGTTRHTLGSGSQPLTTGNGGNAIFILPVTLPAGRNVITAKFLGTADWMPRDSNPVVVEVK
jgi:hypothetical protein